MPRYARKPLSVCKTSTTTVAAASFLKDRVRLHPEWDGVLRVKDQSVQAESMTEGFSSIAGDVAALVFPDRSVAILHRVENEWRALPGCFYLTQPFALPDFPEQPIKTHRQSNCLIAFTVPLPEDVRAAYQAAFFAQIHAYVAAYAPYRVQVPTPDMHSFKACDLPPNTIMPSWLPWPEPTPEDITRLTGEMHDILQDAIVALAFQNPKLTDVRGALSCVSSSQPGRPSNHLQMRLSFVNLNTGASLGVPGFDAVITAWKKGPQFPISKTKQRGASLNFHVSSAPCISAHDILERCANNRFLSS